MRNRIKTTAQKLKLLYEDREIGGNLVLWSFIKFLTGPNKVKQAAAALTYHTLFALVPVMAMMIAVANLMGYGQAFREKVEAFFAGQENIANELLKFVDMYLGNTDTNYLFGAIVGLAFLLYSVFSIFQTIDESFNSLWELKEHSLKKQIKVFLLVLLIPFVSIVLLAIWMSISSFFEGKGFFHEVNIFVLTTCVYIAVLFIAYKFIPNTKVNIRHAAISATFCGIVFAIMQYSASLILGLFSSYKNIYGNLASLMIFILWIYFSWTICLSGSRWNYLLQEGNRLDAENKFKRLSHNYYKFLTMLTIAKCKEMTKESESKTFTIKEIAAEMSATYGISVHAATKIMYTMERKGIIAADNNDRYSLCNEFMQDSETQLIDILDRAGNNDVKEIEQHLNGQEKELWQKINGVE
ncbi:MAG: YihY/virulence factor BrkB family protein [Bacteroidaceae bacterium]|nr:YihY/virulence factor BrkB family protein [Bacteroidaceae bacterium]